MTAEHRFEVIGHAPEYLSVMVTSKRLNKSVMQSTVSARRRRQSPWGNLRHRLDNGGRLEARVVEPGRSVAPDRLQVDDSGLRALALRGGARGQAGCGTRGGSTRSGDRRREELSSEGPAGSIGAGRQDLEVSRYASFGDYLLLGVRGVGNAGADQDCGERNQCAFAQGDHTLSECDLKNLRRSRVIART